MALIKSSPGQKWPGFSFALHLLRVQGFCFALLQYSPIQAFTARFAPSMQLHRPRHKTAHRALQGRFLQFTPFYRRRYHTGTSGYNTTCDTLEHIHAPGRLAAYTRYHRHAGRCAGQHSRPIIIMYIRAYPLLWIHARRCSTSQTMPARRGPDIYRARRLALWHWVSLTRSNRRGSPAAGARRAARNHWRLSPYLFSGFRPIANRGQQ